MSIEAMELAFEAYCKTLHPLWNTGISRTEAKGFFEAGFKTSIAEAEKQEPVAYLSNKRQRLNIELKPQTFVEIPTVTDWEMPLYMKPQQRTWVALTDEEFEQLLVDAKFTRSDLLMIGACVEDICNMVEAKLKEKNT